MLIVFFLGCAPALAVSAEAEDSGHNGVDCGEATTYDIAITAMVVEGARPAAGIEVVLDDRGWTQSELGVGTTGSDGKVTFTAVGVTSLPNCWGTVLDYWLVATDPADASRTAEDGVNSSLYNAIDGGTLETDVTDWPLEL
jgi:hypothetical protein